MFESVPPGVLSAIGGTPLVRLARLHPEFRGRIHAKLERFNPGGSIKDRPALNFVLSALREGRLVPGRSVVVESSSGNLGIGLAQVCRYFDLDFICVVDPRTTKQNLAVISAYGARVEMVEQPDPVSGEFLPARLGRVRELLERHPGAYWPNQYANPLNPEAHLRTCQEIFEAVPGPVDYLFCSTGTTGTLGGCARYIREAGLPTKLVAVDAVGSVLFQPPGPGPRKRRLIPGHGAAVRPQIADPSLADQVVHVSDLDCVIGCRQLIRHEAIMAGGSSGGTVTALDRLLPSLPADAVCVLMLPDGGERYLDTIYNDDWVVEHFGEVTHLWKNPVPGSPEAVTC